MTRIKLQRWILMIEQLAKTDVLNAIIDVVVDYT